MCVYVCVCVCVCVWGVCVWGGGATPPIIYPIGKPESSQKIDGFSEKARSIGMISIIGENYTIKLDIWKLFSKQKLRTRQVTSLCYIKV